MTLCLNMIVKDEAPVIARCLASVRTLVDHWVIVDTGSTDGTQRIVREALSGIPGELHERPWRDFGSNRTEALELARPHGDYLFFIDADDTLAIAPGVRLGSLEADAYTMEIVDGAIVYATTAMVRSAHPWRWRGVLHEFLFSPGPHTRGSLDGMQIRRHHDGARRRAGDTYLRDATILEAALQGETDTGLAARYTFYLAQSYKDAGRLDPAIRWYLRRAELGLWDEEVFVSLLYAGRLMERRGDPADAILAVLERATLACPRRAEALYSTSVLCFRTGRYREGKAAASRALGLPKPREGLFLETTVYDHDLLDLFAIHADRTGDHRDGLEACLALLGRATLPVAARGRVLANAQKSLENIPRQSDLGRLAQPGFVGQHPLAPDRQFHEPRPDPAPRVLVAILAKQKEAVLPFYLDCIERLDYPKQSIVLYIRTNNNTDRTADILRAWTARVATQYAGLVFDAENVPEPVESFGVHEWNATRFKVLGRIRQASLRATLEHRCDFYFVADVDNFIRASTLTALVTLDLPIAAPLLRSVSPIHHYSNYHAEIDDKGYYKVCDQYLWILNRWVRGVLEVPVVHCTYLVRADVTGRLSYDDGSSRFEYVIFSDSARKAGVPQYLDNRQVYGYITFAEGGLIPMEDSVARAKELMAAGLADTPPIRIDSGPRVASS